jgi:predicted transposase/invertase (TIGR01784 family)
MPEIFDLVDFSEPIKSLDNEFKTLFPESESDDRRVDKLVEVKLKNGENKWILLHIEIQSYEDKYFAKRMYHYYSRIFDRYDKEIEAIAVFTYQANRHKQNKYESKFIKTKLSYEYPIYDIAVQNIEELKKSSNPFSFVIQTLIKSFNYNESDENNFNFKKELFSLLLNSGFTREEIQKVFRFINFVFEIQNKKLRSKFYKEVNEMSANTGTKFELTDYDTVVAEKAIKDDRKEIAKEMKENNEPIEKIVKYTGLTIEEIENL